MPYHKSRGQLSQTTHSRRLPGPLGRAQRGCSVILVLCVLHMASLEASITTSLTHTTGNYCYKQYYNTGHSTIGLLQADGFVCPIKIAYSVRCTDCGCAETGSIESICSGMYVCSSSTAYFASPRCELSESIQYPATTPRLRKNYQGMMLV